MIKMNESNHSTIPTASGKPFAIHSLYFFQEASALAR